MALYCTIVELFDVEECRDFERSFKVTGNDTIRYVERDFLFIFVVTMAVHCIVSEIKQNIGRKSRFVSCPLIHNNPWGECFRAVFRNRAR